MCYCEKRLICEKTKYSIKMLQKKLKFDAFKEKYVKIVKRILI